jgi:hypothetical protein
VKKGTSASSYDPENLTDETPITVVNSKPTYKYGWTICAQPDFIIKDFLKISIGPLSIHGSSKILPTGAFTRYILCGEGKNGPDNASIKLYQQSKGKRTPVGFYVSVGGEEKRIKNTTINNWLLNGTSLQSLVITVRNKFDGLSSKPKTQVILRAVKKHEAFGKNVKITEPITFDTTANSFLSPNANIKVGAPDTSSAGVPTSLSEMAIFGQSAKSLAYNPHRMILDRKKFEDPSTGKTWVKHKYGADNGVIYTMQPAADTSNLDTTRTAAPAMNRNAPLSTKGKKRDENGSPSVAVSVVCDRDSDCSKKCNDSKNKHLTWALVLGLILLVLMVMVIMKSTQSYSASGPMRVHGGGIHTAAHHGM